MRLKKDIKPVDVGIWKFWMRDTTREDTAVYQCRGCGAKLRSNPQMLPGACPFCDYDCDYEKSIISPLGYLQAVTTWHSNVDGQWRNG